MALLDKGDGFLWSLTCSGDGCLAGVEFFTVLWTWPTVVSWAIWAVRPQVEGRAMSQWFSPTSLVYNVKQALSLLCLSQLNKGHCSLSHSLDWMAVWGCYSNSGVRILAEASLLFLGNKEEIWTCLADATIVVFRELHLTRTARCISCLCLLMQKVYLYYLKDDISSIVTKTSDIHLNVPALICIL